MITRLFAAQFAALAFAHLWLVLASSFIAVIIGAGIWVIRPVGRDFRPLLETVVAVG